VNSGIVEMDIARDNRHFRVSRDFFVTFDGIWDTYTESQKLTLVNQAKS
jgi:hypothetical protein